MPTATATCHADPLRRRATVTLTATLTPKATLTPFKSERGAQSCGLKRKLWPNLRRSDYIFFSAAHHIFPFTPKPTVPWNLRTRGTSNSCNIRHVSSLPCIPRRSDRSQVMKGRRLVGSASAQHPLHCQLKDEQNIMKSKHQICVHLRLEKFVNKVVGK